MAAALRPTMPFSSGPTFRHRTGANHVTDRAFLKHFLALRGITCGKCRSAAGRK